MRQLPPTHYFLIAMTFLAGIFLTIIPFPQWIIWARPQWIFALTCYWILTSPSQCGLVAAWTAGFLMDLITGTPLGQQAFVFVLLAYFLLKIYPVVAYSPIWQQASFIGFFFALNGLCQGMIFGWAGQNTHILLHFISAMTTALIWPTMVSTLNRVRPKAFIR